jgi:CheY-like chemotaxis protein
VNSNIILVVDDERAIADTLAAILVMSGYEAVATYGAIEAVAILGNCEPALIITDVIMPEMNGLELAGKARDMYPRTKILLMSGNAVTQDILDAAGVARQSFEVVAKPVPPRQMLSMVASLMGTSSEQKSL